MRATSTNARVAVVLGAFAVFFAACDEHFPKTVDELAPTAPAPAPDEPSDAALTPDADLDASVDADAAVVALDGAACNVRVDAPALADGLHVSDGTPIAYASNPPSSGPHYGTWANFQEFTRVIDDGYLVHSLEHGAVNLFYRCADDASAACAETIAQLRAVRAAVPTDPACSPAIRVRVILAPRPSNDVAVSASAWGHTYRADCVDPPSLLAFIEAHYAKAPEDFCFQGGIF